MKKRAFSLGSISFYGWRAGPREGKIGDVADIARERIKAPSSELFERRRYRPKTLRGYIDKYAKELGATWR
jgi:hypothetical protein